MSLRASSLQGTEVRAVTNHHVSITNPGRWRQILFCIPYVVRHRFKVRRIGFISNPSRQRCLSFAITRVLCLEIAYVNRGMLLYLSQLKSNCSQRNNLTMANIWCFKWKNCMRYGVNQGAHQGKISYFWTIMVGEFCFQEISNALCFRFRIGRFFIERWIY